MALTKEQLNIVKNVDSLEELKQKAKENRFEVNDELLEDFYNSYHSELELSDNELGNVTGGCGDKEVGIHDKACKHYEHSKGWTDPPASAKICWWCKHVYSKYTESGELICYCSY